MSGAIAVRLYEKQGDILYSGKLFYRNEGGYEMELSGVSYLGGTAVVIR